MTMARHRGAEAPAELARRVLVFNALPIDYLHPDRVEALLPPELRADTPLRQEALASRRMRQRLSRRLLRGHCSEPCKLEDFGEADRRMLLAGAELVGRVTLLAGAIRRGRLLKTVVTGTARRQVHEAIGAEAYAFALAHIELSEAVVAEVPLDRLRRVVEDDGLGCLKAWSAELPEGVRDRLALMQAPDRWGDGQAPDRFRARGAKIVSAVAREVLSDA